MTCTSGHSRSIASAVGSCDPLSTTYHSTPIEPTAACARRSVLSASSVRLWVTTMTLRSGCPGVSCITESNAHAGGFLAHGGRRRNNFVKIGLAPKLPPAGFVRWAWSSPSQSESFCGTSSPSPSACSSQARPGSCPSTTSTAPRSSPRPEFSTPPPPPRCSSTRRPQRWPTSLPREPGHPCRAWRRRSRTSLRAKPCSTGSARPPDSRAGSCTRRGRSRRTCRAPCRSRPTCSATSRSRAKRLRSGCSSTRTPTSLRSGSTLRLANAAVTGLTEYLTQLQQAEKVSASNRVVLRPLGQATGGVDAPSASKTLGLMAFLGVFVLWCAMILVGERLLATWRISATYAPAGTPPAGTPPAGTPRSRERLRTKQRESRAVKRSANGATSAEPLDEDFAAEHNGFAEELGHARLASVVARAETADDSD